MKPFQSSNFSVLLAPSAAATAVRTASVDITDADYCTIVISASAEVNTNSTNVTVAVARGDSGSSWTTLATALLDNTAANTAEFHINTVGKGKYIQVTSTPGTHTTNDPVLVSAVAILDPANKGASEGTVVN